MSDYQRRWWYVERPFPWWLLVAICTALAVLVLITVEVLK